MHRVALVLKLIQGRGRYPNLIEPNVASMIWLADITNFLTINE